MDYYGPGKLFSLLTTTSFFEAFKVTFISFPPTTLSADLLTAMLQAIAEKGAHQNAFQVFFLLVRTLMERRLAPFFPGRLSYWKPSPCALPEELDVQQLNVVEGKAVLLQKTLIHI